MGFEPGAEGVTYSYMHPVGTLVAFGSGSARAAAQLDLAALACELIEPAERQFARIKSAQGGSLLLLLLEGAGDAELAAASKAAKILKKRGGRHAVVVLPPTPANPGPQASARLERAARLTQAVVLQPVGHAWWADAARCLIEPLAVFGLVGIDPREIHALLRPRPALLHLWNDPGLPQALRPARDVLVTCRLGPAATLHDVDDAARRVRELTKANLVLAGPEVESASSPIVASFF